MSKHDLQERLINGFSHFGYELTASDGLELHNEFRKPGAAIVFTVKPAEGGIYLFWTENKEHDLVKPTLGAIGKNMPPDVQHRPFCGSPDEFWQAVGEIIGEK